MPPFSCALTNRRPLLPILLTVLALGALLAACGRDTSTPVVASPAPQTATERDETPAAPAGTILADETAAQPTPSPVPTATAAAGPSVRVLHEMNVRAGPSTDDPILGSAQADQRFPITGRNAGGDWWQIDFNGQTGWVYAPLVEASQGTDVAVVAGAVASPAPDQTPTPAPDSNGLAPAPAPVGTVVVYETSVTLPTYPYERFQSDAVNEEYNWPYKRFDQERFEEEAPEPEARTYRLLVLENSYLQITVLPDLGGRLWQVIHKATGANMFYQNSVVKPSPWGPAEQLGWFALGGLEWNLPVVEHGYDWGVPWGHLPLQHSPELASITVFTPRDGRFLNASITISLRAGAGSFEIDPTVSNLSDQAQTFAYWQTAMLAPGSGNRPSARLHFVMPGSQMTLHSSGDPRLPAPGQPFDWPLYNGVDYSVLGNWRQYLGFFERPAAHGPFVGVYDATFDAGAVRVYPASVARGSKAFGLGWQNALDSDIFTDDDSGYVELHGGLAPTFDADYRLPPGGSVTWREIWYPVHAIGGLTYADEVAAVHVQPTAGGLTVGFYPTRPLDGTLVAAAAGQELGRRSLQVSPDHAFSGQLVPAAALPASGPLQIAFLDGAGRTLFTYEYQGPLR